MRLTLAVLTRFLSTLTALALVALGAVTLIDLVSTSLDRGRTVLPQRTVDELGRRPWDDRTVVVTLAAGGLLALVLLVVGLWRRAPLTVAVAGRPAVRLERRALEQTVTRQLSAIDGVSAVTVRAGRKRLAARLDTNRRLPPTELQARAETDVAAILTRYGIELPTRVNVRSTGGNAETPRTDGSAVVSTVGGGQEATV